MKYSITIEADTPEELIRIINRIEDKNVVHVENKEKIKVDTRDGGFEVYDDEDETASTNTDVTYKDIANVLMAKHREDKYNDIKSLLERYGVKSAKSLDESVYVKFIKDAEVL